MSSALAFSVCLLAAGASTVSAQDPPTGTWAAESSGNYYEGTGSTSDGTYLYLVGNYQPPYSGSGETEDYQHLRRYDPVNNTWTSLADLPFPLGGNACAYYGGRIFSFGGGNLTPGSNSFLNSILAYSISSNSWTTLSATLSAAKGGHAAARIGDRIYVTGGVLYGFAYTDINDEFNATTDSVTARAPMPSVLAAHMSCAVPSLNRLYVMTGRVSNAIYGASVAVNYEYTPPDDDFPDGRWTTRAPLVNGNSQPVPLWYSHGFALNNRVYLAGGVLTTGSYSSQTWEYSPFTDSWAQRANMSNQPQVGPMAQGQRCVLGAAAIGGKGYVHGGWPSSTSGEEFTPPNFGASPNPPNPVLQVGPRPETSLQAKADPQEKDGWINETQITFSAGVTDPDPGQQVRLRVQVKAAEDSWTEGPAITDLDSGLTGQGTIQVIYGIPRDGAYDWRWRVEDAFSNPYPLGLPSENAGWIEAFGNSNSPDFRRGPPPEIIPAPTLSGGVTGHDDDEGRCGLSARFASRSPVALLGGLAILTAMLRRRRIRQ